MVQGHVSHVTGDGDGHPGIGQYAYRGRGQGDLVALDDDLLGNGSCDIADGPLGLVGLSDCVLDGAVGHIAGDRGCDLRLLPSADGGLGGHIAAGGFDGDPDGLRLRSVLLGGDRFGGDGHVLGFLDRCDGLGPLDDLAVLLLRNRTCVPDVDVLQLWD